MRTASLAPRIEDSATEDATGSSRTPVDSAPYPLRNWKYWVTRKMNPDSAKNEIATDVLAAVKRALRNRLTARSRVLVRHPQATHPPVNPGVVADPPTVWGPPQPAPGASVDGWT